jgi:hypothetical protein
MIVKLFVDPGGGTLTDAGVAAHLALVLESNRHPGDFSHPQRQPAAVVDGIAEVAERRA